MVIRITVAMEFGTCFCAFWDLFIIFYFGRNRVGGGGGGGGGGGMGALAELSHVLDPPMIMEYFLGTN